MSVTSYFTCLILALFCLRQSVSGQTSRRFSLGPQAGISRTTITGEYAEEWQKNYLVGLVFRFEVAEQVAVGLEVDYERKGINSGHSPLGGGGAAFTINEYFNYLTNNALYEYNFRKGQGFYLQGGAYVAYLLGKKNESQTDLNKPLDLGVLLRVGYLFSFKRGGDVRLYLGKAHGFISVDEDGDNNKNRAYMACLQVLIQ